MKTFWERAKNGSSLKELIAEGRLKEIIGECISKALDGADISKPFASRFLKIERERLSSLLEEWLELESQRPPFKVIEREKREEVPLEELIIRGDIDRIDEADGGKIIIDYKTGRADASDWEGDRPKEPQMMLYSLTNNFDAVTFARVRRGECAFNGLSRHEEALPGVKSLGDEAWEEMMREWEGTIRELAKDFLAGEATVDPRDFGGSDSACRYCELTILCRIFDRE